MKRYEFSVLVDHAQFYLEDSALKADTSLLWEDNPYNDIFALASGLVAVATARYSGKTRVIVEVGDKRPDLNLEKWDQVAECNIEVPSGQIIIYSPEQNPQISAKIT